jgi:hypothetical protein
MHSLDPVWETIKDQFTAARFESAQAARAEVTNELNQCFRRLRQYHTEGEWISAILDSAASFVHQVALFTYEAGSLRLRSQKNLNLSETLTFSAADAAAFQNVISSKDTLVALRTPAEVGAGLSSPDVEERAHIVPILNGPRIVAFLFAVGQGDVDLNAIELIASLASTVLERQSNASLHTQIANQFVGTTQHAPESTPLPSWANLNQDQRLLHIRAQRFARVKVAEMQLLRPDACHAGRQQGNLYVFLRPEIDKARETYRRQFMTIPSMVDYLHIELVRNAAEGDERKLGEEYPGQLV